MLFNVNCSKRSQMITPEKLFPLPQDVYLKKGQPKGSKEDFEKFLEKVKITDLIKINFDKFNKNKKIVKK